MCSAADPGTRHNSAPLYQISVTFSILTGALWTLSEASCSDVIIVVLLDAGLHIGCSQDNIFEAKPWANKSLRQNRKEHK